MRIIRGRKGWGWQGIRRDERTSKGMGRDEKCWKRPWDEREGRVAGRWGREGIGIKGWERMEAMEMNKKGWEGMRRNIREEKEWEGIG